LDLSDFNHPLNNFEGFVKELEGFERLWEFEETMLYLTLPDLGRVNSTYSQIFPEVFLPPSRRKGQKLHSGLIVSVGSPASRTISRLLDWLHDVKGVKSIVELKIPDDHAWPLSEPLVLRKLLKKFAVRRVDWRKLDLDLSALTVTHYPISPLNRSSIETGAPKVKESEAASDASFLENLREIRLYSSGNWGVLYHWASSDGLKKFPKVRQLLAIKERVLTERSWTKCTSLLLSRHI
jgi:hypothetical protein